MKGDFITVRDNGWTWGGELHPLTATRFNPPRFFIVKVPTLSVSLAEKYVERETESIIEEDGEVYNRRTIFRKWHLLVDNFPQLMKDKIRDEGEVTVTPNQIKPYIRDKVTGQTEG